MNAHCTTIPPYPVALAVYVYVHGYFYESLRIH